LSAQLDEVVAHLAAARTLSVLPVSMLRSLAPIFRPARLGPGQIVSREGDLDGTLYIVTDGAIALDRLEGPARRHVATLAYGDVLGERGVFAGLPSDVSAVALQPTSVLAAGRDELWSALTLMPSALDLLVLPDDVRSRMELPQTASAAHGERTVSVVHKHKAALAANLALPALVLLVALPLALVLASFASTSAAIVALAAVGLGLPALTGAYAVADYRGDYLVLTNRRVIHHKRTPLVRSRRVDVPLERIQDVQVEVPGVLARSLGFGTLRVQSAGSARALEFDTLAGPDGVKRLVFRLAELAALDTRRERTDWIAERLAPAVNPEPASVEMPGVADVTDESGAAPDVAASGWQLRASASPFTRRPRKGSARARALEADEFVVWRKHWWFLLKKSGLPALATIACLAAAARTAAMGGPLPLEIWLVGCAALGALSWYGYADWRNDVYVLTRDQIIDVERKPLGLHEERRSASLAQLQDIRHLVPNPLATALDFGDVLVETAAETGRFTFHGVPHPSSVHDQIAMRMERYRVDQDRLLEERRADELTQWFRQYHRMAQAAGYVDVNKGLATSDGIG
jgi:CRP-like cAMP-binding protein